MLARDLKNERRVKGFTLAEVLLSVALIGVVAAFAFVSITHYQRSMYQLEMDETAKEIYIAAQNHLTVADGLGTLSKKTPGHEADADKGIYYYVVGDGSSDRGDLNNTSSLLYTMLPPRSIDETVRSKGSYIIRYQLTGASAKVLDVFYANPNGQFKYTFEDDDYSVLFAESSDYTDPEAGKEDRADYEGGIIGFYGGTEESDGSSESLPIPKLEIYNDEVLSARIINFGEFDNTVRYEFYVTGETSGAISTPLSYDATDARTIGGTRCIESIIDSVTQQGAHFADLESTVEGKAFIPGENVKIQVFAIDTQSTKVSKSARRTANSLFASVGTMGVSDLIAAFEHFFAGSGFSFTPLISPVAKVASIRHLENLSQSISGFNPSDGSLGPMTPVSYEQVTNMSWSDFCKLAAGLERASDGTLPDDTAQSLAIRVWPLEGAESAAHTYMPVDWSAGNLTYEGNGLAISGIEIDSTGDAGLFGTVQGTSTISNLELVDFTVGTTSGDAGALAGKLSGSVSGVLVRNEVENDASGGYGISGSGNVGGLVGALSSGSVDKCAAAVYVSGGVAGGLVGSAGAATIAHSYSGGHTNGGAYADANTGDRFASNVSGGVAGGLVGSSGASITQCYSTCSVKGTTAGSLVGSGSGAGSGCYAVGAVNGEDWGLVDSAGNDLAKQSYDTLLGGGASSAEPYDPALQSKYGGRYTFKTIAELDASGQTPGETSANELVKHLTTHFGDWPAIVEQVKNKRG